MQPDSIPVFDRGYIVDIQMKGSGLSYRVSKDPGPATLLAKTQEEPRHALAQTGLCTAGCVR